MSNINKQALREAAEKAVSEGEGNWQAWREAGQKYPEVFTSSGHIVATVNGAFGVSRSNFIAAANPSTVLALLDELEAKDSMIAAQRHEIRTLLNALEGRPCPKCNDTGMADSGGTQPWGEPISVPCDCAAPPAPVALPSGYSDFEEIWSSSTHPLTQDDEMKDFAWDIWNACRAAMLQGADVSLTHEGKNHHEDKLGMVNHLGDVTEKVEPVTQIEPVADLYGLTSPTGGETSFTFDAVEARDFIDGGWSCQEYVELERFQEAVSGNSPVIPDGWVACSERMPEKGRTLALFGKRIKEVCANYVDEGYIGDDGEFYFFDWEGGPRIDDCHPYDKAIVTHWMYWELPAAPKGEHRDAYDIEAFGIFSATEGENGLMLQIERFRFGTEKCPQIGKVNMVPKFALQGVINRLQEHCDSMGNEALVDILSTPAAPQQETK